MAVSPAATWFSEVSTGISTPGRSVPSAGTLTSREVIEISGSAEISSTPRSPGVARPVKTSVSRGPTSSRTLSAARSGSVPSYQARRKR